MEGYPENGSYHGCLKVVSDEDDEAYEVDEDDEDYEVDEGDPIDDGFIISDEVGSDLSAGKVQVITKESLLAAQKDDLQRVMDLLSLKEHHARTLLIHYRWDVDKIFSVFVEQGKARLYAEAGVMVDCEKEPSNLSSESFSNITCQICFEEVPADKSTTMDCGHCFCNNCWIEYFVVKITEGQSKRITCMTHKCNAICDEGRIRNLVGSSHPHLVEKFDRFLLESFIEDNKKVKWCPSIPHCGNAIHVDGDEYCEVECSCGLQFCFNCSSEVHSPCSCLMWKLWMRKCEDESETVNWITVNTKLCPKCHKPVEKNGGCNLVCCICGQPFCWLCGGATGRSHTWDSIEGHTCGRFKEEEVKKTEQAKKKLWRYSHYYNRYKAHMESLKAEATMKEKLQEKILKLEEREFLSRDCSWVTCGLYRLLSSRRILAYSYPFAYYMFGDDLFKNEMTEEERTIKQNLFEDWQQQLEENVEKLSLFLGEPFADFADDKVSETRMNIINLSTITDKRCRKLYECIDNDLLGPLQQAIHIIAPYHSAGVEKAS